MDPISQAGGPTATDPAATANTAAEFQLAFDQALLQTGTAVISIALEDLIQISQEDL